MTADVSSLVRILNGYLDEQRVGSSSAAAAEEGSSSNELITRDLFGGGSSSSSTTYSRNKNFGSFTKDVVDLDLEVPSGWEKRLDLKSGKVYLQRSDSPISSSTSTTSTSSDQQHQRKKENQTIQDLNLNIHPSSDDDSLDLKLVPSYDYGSVCTLDKVKSALERAAKAKKRSLSSVSIDQSTSTKSKQVNEEGRLSTTTPSPSSNSNSSGLLYAGGCPKCLMYVMISKTNPKCPRCNSIVPTPPPIKKPKLDLNLNLLSSSW